MKSTVVVGFMCVSQHWQRTENHVCMSFKSHVVKCSGIQVKIQTIYIEISRVIDPVESLEKSLFYKFAPKFSLGCLESSVVTFWCKVLCSEFHVFTSIYICVCVSSPHAVQQYVIDGVRAKGISKSFMIF